MKLLIVRHGDPDYSIDSLTPTGWVEAELLSHRLSKLDVKQFYVSPLGRAKDTAKATLEKMGRTAIVKPWLREPAVPAPANKKKDCFWDWLPQDWTANPDFYNLDKFWNAPFFQETGLKEIVLDIWKGLDELLADHGYIREGNYYRAEQPNEDTIVLFCHFGLKCVLLSHLLNISPVLLWHGTCAAPTSVTTLNTEERREGIAYFRMSAFGDTSHLYAAGREPSFAARFCETYAQFDPSRD
jgi:probable phosphoglycerate mutase